MAKDVLKRYQKAAKATALAQAYLKKELQPGAKMFDVAEGVEAFIIKKGAKPAFPVNLSVDNNAAHQTPEYNEQTVVKKEWCIKVDVGCHVEGHICDTAFTQTFEKKWAPYVKAAEGALEAAFKVLKGPDTEVGTLGTAIEDYVRGAGYNPIQNLSGHGLGVYEQHTPPTIPNVSNNDERSFEEGMAYAIEPFITDGDGFISEGGKAEIFELEEPKPVRHSAARTIFKHIAEEYKTMPFAERWLQRELKLSEFQLKVGLKELIRNKCLHAYPVLHEAPGKQVAQAEDTFLIHKGKVVRLLKGAKKK